MKKIALKNLQTLKIILVSLFLVRGIPCFAESDRYTLQDLTSSMLQNNPDIRSAQEEYRRSVMDYKDALAGFGPKIDLQLSGTYMVNPPVGSVYVNVDELLGAVNWPAGIKPQSSGQHIKVYDGMENTMYNFGLTLEQPVFTWGKLHQAAMLYKEVSKIQEIKLSNSTKQLSTELETRIVSLGYLYKISELLKEEEIYADEMVSFSEDAEKSGMLLRQDVIEARIKAKELEIALQGLNEQIAAQEIELQRLTGLENLQFDEIDYVFDEEFCSRIMGLDREESLQKALGPQSDSIRMVGKAAQVSSLAEKISKNSVYWKPDIGLQMSLGYGGSRFPLVEPNWLRKDDYSLNISLGVKTTVWDGGKKLRDVSRAISNSESARINEDAVKATVRKTLMEQWNTADVCEMKIEYQILKIETAESKIAQEEVLYGNGYGSKTDLLSAKIDLCNAKIEKLQQELTRAAACMTINFLVQ